MTAKEYLLRLRDMEREIKRLEHKHAQIMDTALPGGIDYSLPRVDHSSSGDSMPRVIAQADAIQRKINCKKCELSTQRAIAATYIAMIPDTDAAYVLRRRYLGYWPFDRIAREMKISERKVYYLHGVGLRQLEDVLMHEGVT